MQRKAMLAATVVLVVASVGAGLANNGIRRIKEFLNGYKEVPVISTTGKGSFVATINREGTEIQYRLKYSDLEAPITQSHIHFGPPNNTGAISVWLCSSLNPPGATPPGTQACPTDPASGEYEGTLTAADVVGPAAQGIDVGEFDELLAAIRAGKTYVNVHTQKFPGGEIRSQIEHDESDDHGGHDRH